MKEINAVVRMNKVQKIKDALTNAGYHSLTIKQAMGRGKQRGLLYDFTKYVEEPAEFKNVASQLLAKRMLILIVEDERLEKAIQVIIKASHTGEIGDGKIFVMPIGRVVRIRTSETDNDAL